MVLVCFSRGVVVFSCEVLILAAVLFVQVGGRTSPFVLLGCFGVEIP